MRFVSFNECKGVAFNFDPDKHFGHFSGNLVLKLNNLIN